MDLLRHVIIGIAFTLGINYLVCNLSALLYTIVTWKLRKYGHKSQLTDINKLTFSSSGCIFFSQTRSSSMDFF